MILWQKVLELKTVSEANSSEHWRAKHKRHVIQRNFIRAVFMQDRPEITLPCKIVLTRVSPRSLDTDNLPCAFKWIRDAIADLIIPGLAPGRADGDELIEWVYEQEKQSQRCTKITILTRCE